MYTILNETVIKYAFNKLSTFSHFYIRPSASFKIQLKKMIKNNMQRQEGHWALVAHLRMTVYKGIGEHSSSRSPAMNFDRLAVSLRLNMGYVDNNNRMTSTNKTCDIRGGARFGRQRRILNKLGRGSQDNAINIISRTYA